MSRSRIGCLFLLLSLTFVAGDTEEVRAAVPENGILQDEASFKQGENAGRNIAKASADSDEFAVPSSVAAAQRDRSFRGAAANEDRWASSPEAERPFNPPPSGPMFGNRDYYGYQPKPRDANLFAEKHMTSEEYYARMNNGSGAAAMDQETKGAPRGADSYGYGAYNNDQGGSGTPRARSLLDNRLLLYLLLSNLGPQQPYEADSCPLVLPPADVRYICERETGQLHYVRTKSNTVIPARPNGLCKEYVYITREDRNIDACDVGRFCNACLAAEGSMAVYLTPYPACGACR